MLLAAKLVILPQHAAALFTEGLLNDIHRYNMSNQILTSSAEMSRYWGIGDLVAWLGRMLQLGQQPRDSVYTSSTRAQHVFSDRYNLFGEDQLVDACNQMNCEISSCTHSIIGDWFEATMTQASMAGHEDGPSSPQSSSMDNIRNAIGSTMCTRIQEARSSPSISDFASTIEFGLRAWTVHCVEKYISKLLDSTGLDLKYEDLIGYIHQELNNKGSYPSKRYAF